MNLKPVSVLVTILVIAGAGLYATDILQSSSTTSENLEGETSELVTSELDFQGNLSGTVADEDGLKLGTNNTLQSVRLTSGRRVLGRQGNELYITRDGGAYVWSDGSASRVGISPSYGSVPGRFFNESGMIYGNQDREAMFYSFSDQSKRTLATDVLIVRPKDTDADTVSDGAEVILENGTRLTYRSSQDRKNVDWDSDGYRERTYIRDGTLLQNDPQKGEHPVAAADDYLVSGNQLYYSHDSEIYRTEFQRNYRSSGTYTSDVIQTSSGTGELVQVVTETSLNGGDIQLAVIGDNDTKSYELSDGFTSVEPEIRTASYTLEADIRTEDTSDTPVLHSVRVQTAE